MQNTDGIQLAHFLDLGAGVSHRPASLSVSLNSVWMLEVVGTGGSCPIAQGLWERLYAKMSLLA